MCNCESETGHPGEEAPPRGSSKEEEERLGRSICQSVARRACTARAERCAREILTCMEKSGAQQHKWQMASGSVVTKVTYVVTHKSRSLGIGKSTIAQY
eukprot:scaffold19380_cov107-Isochrysis_galbana.AAC.4